jgi:septal ring factor EnvC (AmiA/AmiB activator)
MKVALLQIGELEKLRSDLEKQQNIFAKAQNRHKKEQAELDGLLRKRYDQNRQLRSQQYELQRRLSGLSEKAKNLSDLANRVGPPADSPGGGPGEKARPAARARGVKMRFPVSGMLLLGFGDRGASGYRSDGWRVRANPNALVQAPADGKIEFADSFRGFGRIAIVNHNDGYYSVLTGMESLNVFVGQDVLAGEPIGKMPDKNPEMYLELRRGSKAVDPAVMFMYPR